MDDQTDALIDQLLERVVDLETTVAELIRQARFLVPHKSGFDLASKSIERNARLQRLHDRGVGCQTQSEKKSTPSSGAAS